MCFDRLQLVFAVSFFVMGRRGPKPINREDLAFWYEAWLGVLDGMRCGRYIRKDLKFEAEPELWNELLRADTADEVRAVCQKSQYWLNPKRGATLFYGFLTQNTEHFLAVKRDRRWPRSSRPTSAGRRNRFLAGALAGILVNRSIRTGQDLLATIDKRKSGATYYPLCECGHCEKDHSDRENCRHCSCNIYRYSGGRGLSNAS